MQLSQDNIEEEMALMQETFEIIEEGKQQMGDEVGNNGEDQHTLTTGDVASNETASEYQASSYIFMCI
jgi:hypothetical protein